MKAIWNDTVVAEAPPEDLIHIEGNWYFPPESIRSEYFTPTDHETFCHWKGTANYYTIHANGETLENAAWYYAEPKAGSEKLVKGNYKDYVAFYPTVATEE